MKQTIKKQPKKVKKIAKPKKQIDLHQAIEKDRLETTSKIDEIRQAYIDLESQSKEREDLEKELYKKFCNVNKGKEYTDIEHFENLGVGFDVLIVISEKNTGKTTNIGYKLMKRYYEQGKKIIFMRTSAIECKRAIEEYNETDEFPIKFVGSDIIRAYHKETGVLCGKMVNFKTCNQGSGGAYKGYAAIIYDECCSWDGNRPVNETHLMAWGAMASSVTRSKKEGIKIYCLGNITRNIDLLRFYGIRANDKLRYITRCHKDDPTNVCNILYVNINNIYKGGIKSQRGAAQGMEPQLRAQLYDNVAAVRDRSIIPDTLWDLLDPYLALIHLRILVKSESILVEIRKTPFKKKKNTLYVVRCRHWKPFYVIRSEILADSPIIKNTYVGVTLVRTLEDFINFLYNCALSDSLRFHDFDSQEKLLLLFKNLDRSKYIC